MNKGRITTNPRSKRLAKNLAKSNQKLEKLLAPAKEGSKRLAIDKGNAKIASLIARLNLPAPTVAVQELPTYKCARTHNGVFAYQANNLTRLQPYTMKENVKRHNKYCPICAEDAVEVVETPAVGTI